MKPKSGSTGNLLPNTEHPIAAERGKAAHHATSGSPLDRLIEQEERRITTIILSIAVIINILLLMLAVYSTAVAQTQSEITRPSAPSFRIPISPLSIGDTVPAALWRQSIQIVNHPEGKPSLTLSNYPGKLIILDFWATWCAPCIQSLEKLDSLQRHFGDRLAVIAVTSQPASIAQPFLEKRRLSIPSAVSDTLSGRFFPHTIIPHQVWISKRKIIAITSGRHTTAEAIENILTGKPLSLPVKQDQPDFDISRPLLVNGNGGDGRSLLYQSVITGYIEGIQAGFILSGPERTAAGAHIAMTNASVVALYQKAFGGDFDNQPLGYYNDAGAGQYKRLLLEVPDSVRPALAGVPGLSPSAYDAWLRSHIYCYSLLLPKGAGKQAARQTMAEDLNRFFGARLGIRAAIEKRQVKCLSLVYTGTAPAIHDTLSRQEAVVNRQLSAWSYASTAVPFPVINETGGRPAPVDPLRFVNDPDGLRRELRKHHFDLKETVRSLDMLVISMAPRNRIHP